MNLNIRSTNLFLGAILFLGTGCAAVESSKVDPSTVYTSYSQSYDASARRLEFEATFTVGGSLGTYLILDGASSVTVDGVPMRKNTTLANQVSYVFEKDAPSEDELTRPHAFEYVNNQGQSFRNTATLPGRIQVDAATPTTAAVGSGLRALWKSTTPVGSTETVSATLSRSSSIIQATATAASGTSGEVVFSATQLQSFGAGWANLKICRSGTGAKPQAPQAGGSLRVGSCSEHLGIDLKAQ